VNVLDQPMAVVEFAQLGQRRMRESPPEIVADPRQMLQVSRLTIAPVEPHEQPEDFGIALRRHHRIGLVEGVPVESAHALPGPDIGLNGPLFDRWRNGDARVVIGTRSAVFAPIRNLGLIVVDEEHESSYRQQESPYYNARDVAIVRAQKESATVVLGSATPSLESFHNARKGKYHFVSLPERIQSRPMAEAKIVDMRNVLERHGKPRVFSDELLEAIRETRERGEQSIILLNRRGYSSFILCRSCGETVQCPNCGVTLTYHRSERAHGRFTRSFTLPATVDDSRITAAYKDGVLTVRVPQREEAKPKQITVALEA